MRPKGKFPNWIDFIHSGKKPLIVKAKNNGGGIVIGMGYKSFGEDDSGHFYAIWNGAGNAVWCAKRNFEE